MTAVQTAPTGTTVDVRDGHGRTERPGLVRLTLIELRKLADTRAGMWLLIVVGLAATVPAAVMAIFASDQEQTLNGFFQFALMPGSILLPVLGILSMTSEWSQRTALTTFTLVPARGRVITAKLAAGVLIAVVATAVTLGVAALGTLIAGGDDWSLGAALLGQTTLIQIVSMLVGLGFGALLMNPALAIVTYLALPTVWSILGVTITGLGPATEWLDLKVASMPLTEASVTTGEWARFGVAVAVWAGVTVVLGTVRAMRREVA
jgi:ABC-type transport system involved in multi-copper enzyme maturation permease subunit